MKQTPVEILYKIRQIFSRNISKISKKYATRQTQILPANQIQK